MWCMIAVLMKMFPRCRIQFSPGDVINCNLCGNELKQLHFAEGVYGDFFSFSSFQIPALTAAFG